jgi:NADPH-dependent F420 reductase
MAKLFHAHSLIGKLPSLPTGQKQWILLAASADWVMRKSRGNKNMTKTIAVIGGTGNEGPGLAARWAASGRYKVIIGSRQAEKAERVAAEINENLGQALIVGMNNEAAAAAADIAVLTVPYTAHHMTLSSLKDLLVGKILVDVSVPLGKPVSRVALPAGTSAGQEAQALLGESVRVVSAFQNVSAIHLDDTEHPIDCDVLVCGNDKAAKAEVIALAEAAGMRGVDAGPIENAVVAEGLTAVLIGINIRHKIKNAGIRITGI